MDKAMTIEKALSLALDAMVADEREEVNVAYEQLQALARFLKKSPGLDLDLRRKLAVDTSR